MKSAATSPDAPGSQPRSALSTGAREPWKGWVGAALLVGCAFVVLGLILDGFSPAPQGPAGSSYATTPSGVAAWAELLERTGHPVRQLRQPLGGARLSPSWTVVVLDAPSLSGTEGSSLERFVRAGGRLVIGGGDPAATLPTLVSDPPRFIATGPRVLRPASAAREVEGVQTVLSAGEGGWSSGTGQPLLAAGGSVLLLAQRVGSGRIDFLADPSPIENRLLASADNAQLAIDLAGGGRPVVFAEALHGFGLATGLAAIPGRWWLAFIGLCVAAGAWALARGIRLGPPEPVSAAPVPPRSAYVEAVSQALLRAGDRTGIMDIARRALDRELDRRAGGSAADRATLLSGLGVSDEDAQVVLAPEGTPGTADHAQALALGRVLARLRSSRRTPSYPRARR